MNALPFSGPARRMQADDIARAARRIGATPAHIRAVLKVETGGAGGFLSDGSGRPRILFEAHVFSRLTQRRFDATNPRISAPSWNRALYIGGAGEYERLNTAIGLNRRAALQAASWGLAQVLGQNFGVAGWPDVESFVTSMCQSEGDHLDAMIGFCLGTGCADELAREDWSGFARIYNGLAYAENRYPQRLAAAFAEELGARVPQDGVTLWIGMRGDAVKRLQEALNDRGEDLLADGIYGRATELAVERFQALKRLVVDGIAGPATQRALGLLT